MSQPPASTTPVSGATLGGSSRFVFVCMAIAFAASSLFSLTLPANADAHLVEIPLVMTVIAGMAAYFLVMAFEMFRWVLDGYDERGRRYFMRFLGIVVLSGVIAMFAGIYRREVSPPYPTAEGCWYSLRDRWTGKVEVLQAPCPVNWKPRRELGRLEPIAS